MTLQPTDNNKRIDTLDYLRGFALLGIILVNIPALMWIAPPQFASDIAYSHFLTLFIEGKFFIIFSFLFGIGFYLFLSRAMARNDKAYVLFSRRLLILLLMGIIHFFFQPGEALTVYAIFGFLALPFYKVRKEINVIIGLILLALTAYFGMKIFMPFPLILLGLAAGQYHLFENIPLHRKKILIATIVMFLVSIGSWLYQWQYVPTANVDIDQLSKIQLEEHITNMEQFALIGLQFSPFVSAFYMGAVILCLQSALFQQLLSPLKAYGRMALTNYLGQTALILIIGHTFQLIGQLRFIESLWICLGIYVFQLICSKLWLHYFRFGPLEWLWRMGTYWTVPPLRKRKDS
ncbi:DUF418 domain-containing protein [Lysinibacillus fusiformis]|uniref:DUF418 domain-containing protein n=1 Tax=Lysinibacillus fusiformis TaxID=28031 RepID=UPI00215A47B6|nr:DUF418 domain-containing protein [Lysinibacillus fusiformis]MCR8853967.1 DUF418 domain-containing protein [Lysinibacillus fusiformis]